MSVLMILKIKMCLTFFYYTDMLLPSKNFISGLRYLVVIVRLSTELVYLARPIISMSAYSTVFIDNLVLVSAILQFNAFMTLMIDQHAM